MKSKTIVLIAIALFFSPFINAQANAQTKVFKRACKANPKEKLN